MNTLFQEHKKNAADRRNYSLLLSAILHLALLLLAIIPLLNLPQTLEEIHAIEINFISQELLAEEILTTEVTTNSSDGEHSNNRELPSNTQHQSAAAAAKTILVSEEKEQISFTAKNNNSSQLEVNQKSQPENQSNARRDSYLEKKNRYAGFIKNSNQSNAQTGNDASANESSMLGDLEKDGSTIGNGFGARKAIFIPNIEDGSQKTGKVNIMICIDSKGNVTEAKYTQLGSNSSDAYLIQISKNFAFKYKFTEAPVEKQCGNIFFNYVFKSLD